MKIFWDTFYKQPLDKIPWQNTQADWFKKLVDDGEIKGNPALDLGCGTGMKSMYLAKSGLKAPSQKSAFFLGEFEKSFPALCCYQRKQEFVENESGRFLYGIFA